MGHLRYGRVFVYGVSARSPVGRPWGLNFDGTRFAGGVMAEAAEAKAPSPVSPISHLIL